MNWGWRGWAGASAAAALCLTVGGAGAQVPVIPAPPETSTTLVNPEAPEPGQAPPVPDPASHPAPPTTGGPGPATPVAPGSAPSSTTTLPPPGERTPPQGTAGNGQGRALSLDLSEIERLRQEALGKGPRQRDPDSPYATALPFEAAAGEVTEPDEEVLELGVEDEHIARVRSAASLAGALLSFVLLGLAGWALRQARPGASSES